MQHILVVEDDEAIAMGIRLSLEKEGYGVKCVGTLKEAREMMKEKMDLILLDLNLPDGTGYELCQAVREKSNVPILFLTVRDEEEDMVRGLDMGADDYITKPFKMRVLLSRIQAVLRRVDGLREEELLLGCQDIVIDKAKTKVYKRGDEVELSKGEYKLILLLMENKNCTVTRDHILDYLWGIDGDFVNDNTLTVMMKRLRRKIEGEDCTLIHTVRGIGYRMEG
ncbi:MAG: response regulator transcription factor [Cellulosilyticaceae bacterium]